MNEHLSTESQEVNESPKINPLQAAAQELQGFIESRDDTVPPEELNKMMEDTAQAQEDAESVLEGILPDLPEKIKALYAEKGFSMGKTVYTEQMNEDEVAAEEAKEYESRWLSHPPKYDALVSGLNEQFRENNLPVKATVDAYLGANPPHWRVSIEKSRN